MNEPEEIPEVPGETCWKITMPIERWNALMNDDDLNLTADEIKLGWHFCLDWDGLLVGPGMMEMEHCACQGKSRS